MAAVCCITVCIHFHEQVSTLKRGKKHHVLSAVIGHKPPPGKQVRILISPFFPFFNILSKVHIVKYITVNVMHSGSVVHIVYFFSLSMQKFKFKSNWISDQCGCSSKTIKHLFRRFLYIFPRLFSLGQSQRSMKLKFSPQSR